MKLVRGNENALTLTEEDYRALLRLVQDALDWDPTDGDLIWLEVKLAAYLRRKEQAQPAAQQRAEAHDGPEPPSACPTTHSE